MYSIFTQLDHVTNNIGYFKIVPITEYTVTNNKNNIIVPNILEATSVELGSFSTPGFVTPPENSAQLGTNNSQTVVQPIQLDPANNNIRPLTPGDYYVINTNTPITNNSPISETPGRVTIVPQAQAQYSIKQILDNTNQTYQNAINYTLNNNSGNSNASLNTFFKTMTQLEIDAIKASTKQSTRDSAPAPGTKNNTTSETRYPPVKSDPSTDANPDPWTPPTSLSDAKKKLQSVGHTFSKAINNEPLYSLTNDNLVFNPATEGNPVIIPAISLPFEADSVYKAETYTRIGYTTLQLSVQSINVRTDTGTYSVDILRNQGTLKAIDYNTITSIEFSFSVIGEKQYNDSIVPLLQQFNKTPFLPIENAYLNNVWDVDALAIKEFHVNTMDGIPGGVVARIIAEPFAWWQYLPENDSFTDSWCWPLFKVWCEEETSTLLNRFPTLIKGQASATQFSFMVPNAAAVAAKAVVGNSSSVFSKNTTQVGQPLTLIDEDVATASIVRNSFANNTSITNFDTGSGNKVSTIILNGITYGLMQFTTLRNNIWALNPDNDPGIQVFNSYTVVGATNPTGNSNKQPNFQFEPPNGLSDQEKRVLSDGMVQTLTSRGDVSGTSPSTKFPWFLIPQNSNVWSFVNNGIASNSSSSSNLDLINDFDEFKLSKRSAITSMSVQLANNLVTHQVQQSSLPKHQYVSGADVFLSIQGTLYGEDQAVMLRHVVEEVKTLAREHRPRAFSAPYAGFLAIKNNFVESLGLKEFIPISLSINTMEGFPNLYNFQMDLVEYRQSQKRKEEFDAMDKAILKWNDSLSNTTVTPDQRYSTWSNTNGPENFGKVPGAYKVQPLPTNPNPLSEITNENKYARVWRSSLMNSRLRMSELYPDMGLPTKYKLDYWISLFKYYLTYGELKDKNAQKLVSSMLSVFEPTQNNIQKVQSMITSNDVIGFSEPDFYCIPQIDPKKFMSDMIDNNFGPPASAPNNNPSATLNPTTQAPRGTMHCYDSYGGKFFLAPGKRVDEPEPPNKFVTSEDIKNRNYEIQKLNGVYEVAKLNKQTNPNGDSVSANTGILATPISTSPTVSPYSSTKPTPGVASTYNSFNNYTPGSLTKAQMKVIQNIANNYLPFIQKAINQAGNVPGLDPGLIIGIIKAESNGVSSGPGSVSSDYTMGAHTYGLMQTNTGNINAGITRPFLNALGLPYPTNNQDLSNPQVAIAVGVARIADTLKVFNGNQAQTLQAYNGGLASAKNGTSKSPDSYYRNILNYASYYNTQIGGASQTSQHQTISNASIINNPVSTSLANVKTQLSAAQIPEPYLTSIATNIANNQLSINNIQRLNITTDNSNTIILSHSAAYLWNPQSKTWIPNLVNGSSIVFPTALPPNTIKAPIQNLEGFITYYNYDQATINSLQSSVGNQGEVVAQMEAAGGIRPDLGLPNQPITQDLTSMFVDIKEKDNIGRLVGAFPTYCVLLVDGGRWIGIQRMWDHIYGGFGVNSIDITQSRKDPVDVASVVFSNIYGKLTSVAAYIQQQKEVDYRRNFYTLAIENTLIPFLTGIASKDLNDRWNQWAKMTMLRPGVRLHIRLGYGSDGSQLPVKFNGVVSETPIADNYVQVTALGDGVELIRPFPESDPHVSYDSASDKLIYENTGAFHLHGKDVKNILEDIFTPTRDLLAVISQGRFLADNPYGITHFGSLDYSNGLGRGVPSIGIKYELGEVGVNLYKSSDDPDNSSQSWPNYLTLTGSLAHLWGLTMIGIQVEDSSPWDVIETCRKAVPDYIACVRPFEFRSTLFYGRNWFPFNYRYKRFAEDPNAGAAPINFPTTISSGTVSAATIQSVANQQDFEYMYDTLSAIGKPFVALGNLFNATGNTVVSTIQGSHSAEKDYTKIMDSKAFSQFHVICSNYNLISTNIIADDSNVITNCQSRYVYGNAVGKTITEGEYQQADDNIYPEHKRTKIIKSGLLSGSTYDMEIIPWHVNTAANTVATMTIRDAVADMYQGSNLISGDPYINTWDYVHLMDTGVLLNGVYQVKEVVNHFSTQYGYITTVSPDCLTTTAGNRDSSLWFSLFRVGHSIVSYNIWRATLARMLRTTTIRNIQINLIKAVIGQSRNLRAPLVNAIINSKNSVIAKTKNLYPDIGPINLQDEELAELVAELKKIQKLEKALLNINGGFSSSLKESISRLQAKQFINKLGSQVGASLNDLSATDSLSGKAVAAMQRAWSSSKEGRAAFQEMIKGSETAKALGQSASQIAGGLKATATATKAVGVGEEALAATALAEASTGVGIPLAILQVVAMIAVSSIGDWIGRQLAARHCILCMPLRVNNLEFSAGIEGHFGLVVGDPGGITDNVLASIFNTSFAYNQHGVLGAAVPFIINLLLPGAEGNWDTSGVANNISTLKLPSFQKDAFDNFISKTLERMKNPNSADFQYDNSSDSSSINNNPTGTQISSNSVTLPSGTPLPVNNGLNQAQINALKASSIRNGGTSPLRNRDGTLVGQ